MSSEVLHLFLIVCVGEVEVEVEELDGLYSVTFTKDNRNRRMVIGIIGMSVFEKLKSLWD